jgi:D-glycerate 3-kinase
MPRSLRDALAMLAEREWLPAEFATTFERFWRPYAEAIIARRTAQSAMLVVGLCGPQGSGKSTIAKALQLLLEDGGARAAILSLDDLYLARAERAQLAAAAHPLLQTRGVPGTHDVAMAMDVIDRLGEAEPVAMPCFDKATDDRVDPAAWPIVRGPIDILIFEGWCVGARPQQDDALEVPVNALEAEADAASIWRYYVNARLAGDYAALFARIDYQILLRAPSFEIVTRWRIEQEHKLRARLGDEARTMSDDEIAHFVRHYERLTRHIAAEMPGRAELVVDLDEERQAR